MCADRLQRIVNDISGLLAQKNLNFSNNFLTSIQLGQLIDAIEAGQLTSGSQIIDFHTILKFLISGTSAKSIIHHTLDNKDRSPIDEIAKRLGLTNSKCSLEVLCSNAIESLPSVASAVKMGNSGAINRLVGHVMKLSKGGAKAGDVKHELLRQLGQ
jgi:aspartyl-tRNA(Asn)/glutamyl-tRNA(Gln) amidotransferase subunit B